jgi:kynurenine formamidase
MPEHMGTHIDAPVHFIQGGWKVHQIPMEKLYGPGVIINVKSKVANNPDYR